MIISVTTRLLDDNKTIALHFTPGAIDDRAVRIINLFEITVLTTTHATQDPQTPVFLLHGYEGIFSTVDVMLSSHRYEILYFRCS